MPTCAVSIIYHAVILPFAIRIPSSGCGQTHGNKRRNADQRKRDLPAEWGAAGVSLIARLHDVFNVIQTIASLRYGESLQRSEWYVCGTRVVWTPAACLVNTRQAPWISEVFLKNSRFSSTH